VHRHDEERGLLAHESVHVWQWRSKGVFGFAASYLLQYLGGLRKGLGANGAYLAISFEEEARRLSGHG